MAGLERFGSVRLVVNTSSSSHDSVHEHQSLFSDDVQHTLHTSKRAKTAQESGDRIGAINYVQTVACDATSVHSSFACVVLSMI